MKRLIAEGADVTIGIPSPLCCAAKSGQLSVFHFLMKELKQKEGEISDVPGLLQSAIEGGNRRLITYLIEELHLDIDAGKPSPLHVAIAQGDQEVVVTLLERGANPLARDEQGNTPLQALVQRNQPHLLASFLKCVNQRGGTLPHGEEVLCFVIQNKMVAQVKVLLDYKKLLLINFDSTRYVNDPLTAMERIVSTKIIDAFIEAIQDEQYEIVEALVNAGFNPNHRSGKVGNLEPLFYAARTNKAMVTLLQCAHASPYCQDSEGKYAWEYGCTEAIRTELKVQYTSVLGKKINYLKYQFAKYIYNNTNTEYV